MLAVDFSFFKPRLIVLIPFLIGNLRSCRWVPAFQGTHQATMVARSKHDQLLI